MTVADLVLATHHDTLARKLSVSDLAGIFAGFALLVLLVPAGCLCLERAGRKRRGGGEEEEEEDGAGKRGRRRRRRRRRRRKCWDAN